MATEMIRAARVHDHGPPDALRMDVIALPEPGPGQVRVRVSAMALNHLDIWVRRGIPGVRFPLPLIPGSDAAGVVDAIGPGVGGLDPGRRVFVLPATSCDRCEACLGGLDNLCDAYAILGENRDGTSAEAIVLPATSVAPLPDGIGFVEGAAFGLSFLTAWQMLVRKARVRAGDRVLVHAAGSGVSTAGIQIARLRGARVAATAGREEKLRLAGELGAELTLDYRDGSWVERAREWAGGPRFDVVFDHVGEATFHDSLRVLARGGRYVFCGSTSGHELKTDFRRLFFKNFELLGSTMGPRGDLLRIVSLIGDGRLRPVVDRTFPFEAIADAHAHLEGRRALGKVVVRLDDDG